MAATNRTALLAGSIYLFAAITGAFTLIYAPSKLIVEGNAAATAAKILAHQTLFRIDLVVGLVSLIAFIFVPLILYRLFEHVSRSLSTLMVILVLVFIPQAFATQLLQLGALELVRAQGFLSAIEQTQRETMAMLFIHMNNQGSYFIQMFWGLWLFPLCLLVWRSTFLPRFLSVWLLFNGLAYVAISLVGLLSPNHAATVEMITFPALLGELVFMIWLVVIGFRSNKLSVNS